MTTLGYTETRTTPIYEDYTIESGHWTPCQEYHSCWHRLPCGICKKTGLVCPYTNGVQVPIKYTSTWC